MSCDPGAVPAEIEEQGGAVVEFALQTYEPFDEPQQLAVLGVPHFWSHLRHSRSS